MFDFFEQYKKEERQLRDFIDLDSTFRSINGLQDDFDSLEIENETIFENDNKEDSEKNNDEETEFDSEEENEDTNDVSDLSILEKEESLRPVIVENLKNFSKNFKKYQKIRSDYIESKTSNKRIDLKTNNFIRTYGDKYSASLSVAQTSNINLNLDLESKLYKIPSMIIYDNHLYIINKEEIHHIIQKLENII